MNLLLLSLLIIQNVTSYIENFKNGVNTQFVKDKVKYGPGNEVHNLNSLCGADLQGNTGTAGSYFKSHHPKIDVKKLDSLLNASNYLNPLQYLLKSSESVKMFANSASQLSTYRLSRKLNDDSSNYDDGEDEDSFIETDGSDQMTDKEDDNEDKDQFDDENADSFLEKDEYDDASDTDNDHDTENDEFSADHEDSFLEKDEYDDASDNENDEFYDDDAESFLEQEEYDELSDNENDEFEEDHGDSFLEKEDGDEDKSEDSSEDNGKDYKEEYQSKMTDDDYPDEYVGSDDQSSGNVKNQNGKGATGNDQNGNAANENDQSGNNVTEKKNKEKESFLEKNVNGHTEEEDEKHSTFVSSYLDKDDTEDKFNDEFDDEASFLEEDSYSHNDDEESDDTFDDYYQDSFLERGKLGTTYSDYYEEDADEQDAKEDNEDAFDNYHLNEITTTNDVHSFIQKDMGYLDEIINDNETIKEAVKKGSKKAAKQSMQKLNLLEDEDLDEKESFTDDELNGFMEENMGASKLDAKKAKTTLSNSKNKKNAANAVGKASASNVNAGTSTKATNTTNAATKSNSEASKKQTDLSNEDLFNDELTEEVIADSYEEGGNLGTEEGEGLTNSLNDKLLDQGVNENILLNDNNMIFNAHMVPHKKRELYISPHKHTSATSSTNGKHHTVDADADALDKKLTANEMLELEKGEGKTLPVVQGLTLLLCKVCTVFMLNLSGWQCLLVQALHRVASPVRAGISAQSEQSEQSAQPRTTLYISPQPFSPSPLIGNNSVIVETEEVDVDLNGGKSSSSVSFLSSVVFLLLGLLCFVH